jgi:hypothetical protein
MSEFEPIYMHEFPDDEAIIKEFQIPDDSLDGYRVLLAYYHVGNWGCDSSAFVLLERDDGALFEVNGGHCSCHGLSEAGYSGGSTQWELEETCVEALEHRLEHGSLGDVGGYDDEGYAEQSRAVVEYLKTRVH